MINKKFVFINVFLKLLEKKLFFINQFSKRKYIFFKLKIYKLGNFKFESKI